MTAADYRTLARKNKELRELRERVERQRVALSIVCPQCGQPPDSWCVTRRPRHVAVRLHPERYPK